MKKHHGLLAPWIWVTYLVLFLFAIPWYWDPRNASILLGFPTWVVVSVGVSFLIAAFTSWIFLTRWPSDEEIDS